MLLTVLLISHAAAEWVQISQQHYRKPVHSFPRVERVDVPETSTRANRIYLNQTVTEHVWSIGNVNKVTKHGNVHRVRPDKNSVKAPNIRPINKSKDSNKMFDFKSIGSLELDEDEIEIHELENTFGGILNMSNTQYPLASNIEKPQSMKGLIEKKLTFRPAHNIHVENGKRQQSKTNHNIESIEDDNPVTIKNNKSKGPTLTVSLDKVNPNSLELSEELEVISENRRYDNEKPASTLISTDKGDKVSSGRNKQSITPAVKTSEENSAKVQKTSTKTDSLTTETNNKSSRKPIEETKSAKEEKEKAESAENMPKKENALEKLTKFMKVVADTIRRNTRRSVRSKTRYLENLKDTILANIEQRIDSTWPDDEPAPAASARTRREARGGHLEIPSSESALMTISFLTFAVFLIKLVLQVIQTYKHKSMMLAPAAVVAAVGRSAAASARASKPLH